ncbi:MAG: aspartate:alanine exchanger family transporter [Saprospiraceae bacterium]
MYEETSPELALLYLFIVAALGSWIGNIKVKGSSLSVAAVLFVGLAAGAIRPDIQIPKIITLLGLAMFVYSIGLSSGPSFFSSLKTRGAQNAGFALATLTVLSLLAAGLHYLFGFDPAASAGLLSGVTTNTPALAGLLDAIQKQGGPGMDLASQNAVVGYSISYPMGVVGTMIAVLVARRWLRADLKAETLALRHEYPIEQNLVNLTIEITNPEITGIALRELRLKYGWNVLFARHQHGEELGICHWETRFATGDLVSMLGDEQDVQNVVNTIGRYSEEQLADDRSVFDVRRMFVSRPGITGQPLVALNIEEKYEALVTRVRRGDVDMLATRNTVLELGDRVRILARRKDMPKLQKFFGDSYDSLSQIDLLSFGLGMGLGIMLGSIRFDLPIGITFSLGFAGGPLVAGLALSALRRSGPIVWTLPYSANLTLRQIGLMLMLAAIGINSGHTFVSTMSSGAGPLLFLSGAIVALLGALIVLWMGNRLFRIPYILLMGMISHHPANLGFANDKAGNKLPTFGYALTYPLLLIGKILFVQLLWQVLQYL